MDIELTTENVHFISLLMDSVKEVKNLFDEYCNGYYNLSEKNNHQAHVKSI